jgi:hypothetical protein
MPVSGMVYSLTTRLRPRGSARLRSCRTCRSMVPDGAIARRATIFGLVKRLWIPLLVLAVIIAGGFTVSRLHTVFGSEKRPSYADTNFNEGKSFDPKHMKYEVFGPPGTMADISYFDINSDPQFVQKVSLPWSAQFEISKATAVGSIMAQGDSDSIGCRITVDDEVKAEKISNQVNAFTSCLLKAA